MPTAFRAVKTTRRFLRIVRRAIIADQNAAGDGNLRATIWFRPGRLYDYTNNRWPVGIQYLTVESDPNYSSTGTRPRLRNVRVDFTFDSEISILICGGGTAFDLVQGDIKRYSPRIFTAEPGADTVRLKNKAEAINILPGRWHLVGSYDQQVGGYPSQYTLLRLCESDRRFGRERNFGSQTPTPPSRGFFRETIGSQFVRRRPHHSDGPWRP